MFTRPSVYHMLTTMNTARWLITADNQGVWGLPWRRSNRHQLHTTAGLVHSNSKADW